MKLTPLDIHHKEFRHSLRGYSEEEVDQFLDEVADEFERLFKENIDLSERLEAAQVKLNEFEMQRHTINNTLMAAQRSADEIVAKAGHESETIVRDAELKAKEIIHNALSKKQAVAGELVRIKHAEEEFRARYKALLENNLRTVTEIALPDDVDVLLGETDEGVVGDVAVRSAGPDAAPAAFEPPAPAAPAPAPAVAAPAPRPAPVAQPTQAMPPVEPPASGFVQAVTLGEIGAPDVPADVELVDPGEFSLPSFDMLGEREDDVDIEEID